ncbi:acetyltransferase [Parapedobacter defluvii]|uniref:Acetyltransferase n=1 Tax=Parapedobacter defluvii TaxID=2045106 RepID=A0ABQ1MFK9_9SPHI|nr:NeuD/PglB/VioB family sugar acetyltransferase [Parapedobacter defluvii]GGC38894.1 acetyltransferase [Parapedobacter defluvii]
MIIVGAGGHAKEILTIFSEHREQIDICFFDNISHRESLYSYKVINSIDAVLKYFENTNDFRFVIGVGGVKNRMKIVFEFEKIGGTPTSIISKRAIIGKYDMKLGVGLNIMHNTFISNSVTIGNYSLVNHGASLHHDVKVGNFCEICPMAQLLGSAKVGNHCFIGAGAIILPGIQVGDNVTIGAGALVNKDVESDTTVFGVPATSR